MPETVIKVILQIGEQLIEMALPPAEGFPIRLGLAPYQSVTVQRAMLQSKLELVGREWAFDALIGESKPLRHVCFSDTQPLDFTMESYLCLSLDKRLF